MLDYVKTKIPKRGSTDGKNLDQWKKNVVRARRIILEGVRDHIVSNSHGKENHFTMWHPLIELFQNKNEHRKLTLKEKL